MKIALLLLLIIVVAAPAHAHRPYLIKQGTITGPDGRKIIKEIRYGDGIFVTDPGTFQLRK